MNPHYLNLFDYEIAAKKILPEQYFAFLDNGACDEITKNWNITAFNNIKLLPRVLSGSKYCDLSVTILGQKLRLPIMIAPMAFQKIFNENGELAMVKAADKAGSLMVISSLTTTPLQEIAMQTSIQPWFQLYLYKDKKLLDFMLEKAESAGCSALVVTVDTCMYGKKEMILRKQFTLPETINLPLFKHHESFKGINNNDMTTVLSNFLSPSINWKTIKWIKQQTKLPLILKGIMHPEDALFAKQHGASGIIVSNHGGRQLDTVPAAIEMLGNITKVVEKEIDIYFDSGIRRGSDIFKALALGAKAVLIGRPVLWGLSVSGEAGVTHILNILQQELEITMQLVGCKTISEIKELCLYNKT